MIVKWNNNIYLFFLCYKSILFFFYVGLCQQQKKRTYDIRDSYYKPVAPALCWCNSPGSTPSHRAGLEPGFPAREAGRSNKERQRLQPLVSVARAPLFEVRRVRFTHSPYWHTHLLHWHPTVGINAPPEWGHIAFRLKTGSALIAVWKGTASCSTF